MKYNCVKKGYIQCILKQYKYSIQKGDQKKKKKTIIIFFITVSMTPNESKCSDD